MENPFKKLVHPPKETPKELKNKVMNEISAFKLFTDIAGLFTYNYAQAVESFFKQKKRLDKNNN